MYVLSAIKSFILQPSLYTRLGNPSYRLTYENTFAVRTFSSYDFWKTALVSPFWS